MKKAIATIALAIALAAPSFGAVAVGNARLKGTYAYELTMGAAAPQVGTLAFDGLGHVTLTHVVNGKTYVVAYTYKASGASGAISDGWLLTLGNGNAAGIAQTIRISVPANAVVGGWAMLEN
jgi:hypothetical protein